MLEYLWNSAGAVRRRRKRPRLVQRPFSCITLPFPRTYYLAQLPHPDTDPQRVRSVKWEGAHVSAHRARSRRHVLTEPEIAQDRVLRISLKLLVTELAAKNVRVDCALLHPTRLLHRISGCLMMAVRTQHSHGQRSVKDIPEALSGFKLVHKRTDYKFRLEY